MLSQRPPQHTDYAIVGSGISGALIALDLIQTLPAGTGIVILDARHAASGATGRNGGHIKPGRLAEFNYFKNKYGVKTALAQLAFEKANYEDLTRFIKTEKLGEECDLVLLRAVDMCMNTEGLHNLKSCWEGMRAAGGDMSDMKLHDAAFTSKNFRVPAALGSVSYPAATLWPYKLTIALLKLSIARGVHLCTETPVHCIDRSSAHEPWSLHTPNGTLTAKNVIHATNGYASYLLPELVDKLVPCKGHAAAATPPPTYASSPLQNSYSFHWGDDFDYLIQRQGSSKPLIYGGCDLAGTGDPEFCAGDCNDATINPCITDALRAFPARTFESWEGATETQVWSGIMGFVVDDFPYVGRVPGKERQFICAGYTGRGMARAFLCTKALGQMIRGEQLDARVPPVYFDLEKRWAKKETLSGLLGRNYPCL